jgi:hypothetical protein
VSAAVALDWTCVHCGSTLRSDRWGCWLDADNERQCAPETYTYHEPICRHCGGAGKRWHSTDHYGLGFSWSEPCACVYEALALALVGWLP